LVYLGSGVYKHMAARRIVKPQAAMIRGLRS
jgi:hypothetical protein